MKKKCSRLLALALAAALALGGCSSGTAGEPDSTAEAPSSTAQEEQGDRIEDLVIARLSTEEIEAIKAAYEAEK